MNTEPTEKPLVTFALFAYNQEQYIREALDGAFSQTYSPLEIILSDDCSPDGTFEIMQEMVAAYEGSHEVILNQTERNLGIAGHVNAVMDMAKGELIVLAAGDDISLPERTEKLVSKWLANGRPSGICSEMYYIDQDGKSLVRPPILAEHKEEVSAIPDEKYALLYVTRPHFALSGCSAAWTKHCWESFGHLDSAGAVEDLVLTFRSALQNGIHISGQKLVKYRQHDSNSWSRASPDQLTSPTQYIEMEHHGIRQFKWLAIAYRNMLQDLQNPHAEISLEEEEKNRIRQSLENACKLAQLKSIWWELTWVQRFRQVRQTGEGSILVKLLKLLPLPLYASLRCKLAKIKRSLLSNDAGSNTE